MGRRRKARLVGRTGRRPRRPGFYAEWYDYPGNGRRIHRTRNFLTIGHAREFVRRYNAKADLREIGSIVPIGIQDAGREYIASCSKLATATSDDYANCISALARSVGVNTAIHTIRPAAVESFLNGRTGAQATVARIAANLRQFFAWCIEQSYAPANPVAARKRGHVRERPAVSEADIQRLYDAIDTEHRRVAMMLAMTTGLDRGKIESLTPAHIDFDGRSIVFVRAKTGRPNSVPIHAGLLPVLRDIAGRTDRNRPLLAGLSRQKKDRDWWVRATKSAGLERLLFRDLRALATTRLVRGGASLKDVQALLGHSSILTTASHYLPPDPDTMRRLDALPLPSGRPSAGLTAAI